MTTRDIKTDHDPADDQLGRAINAVLEQPIPTESRNRILEKAAAWQPQRSAAQTRRKFAIAAVVLIAASMAVAGIISLNRAQIPNPIDSKPQVIAQQNPAPIVEPPNDHYQALGGIAAKWVTSIRAIIADDAPILVTNGGNNPIKLGATIPQKDAGGILHVWNYEKSPTSRILPGVEFWSNQHGILSPDGKLLVWARGEILNLETGDKTPIDLGGDMYHFGAAMYQRIYGMKFSPDGQRLALSIMLLDNEQVGFIKGEVVQIVEFPTGKRLCEFPGSSYLKLAFSSDGKQIVTGYKQVATRDATTSQVLRQFESVPNASITGVAISPDARLVAAAEITQGDFFIWNATTGAVTHRIEGQKLRAQGAPSGPIMDSLRFSPDSKHLFIACTYRIFIIDVTTGEIAGTLTTPFAQHVRWSDEGKTITVIRAIAGREGDGELPAGRYDIYPSIWKWDWRTGKEIPLETPKAN